MTIKNREQIIDELVEMLIQFDLDLNSYDTDVYLYLDDEGNAELDTFVNPGGNSWLNDDHYTIYTDKQRYDDILDYWTSISEIADSLEIPEEQLIEETRDYLNYDEDEDVEYYDVCKFINDSNSETHYFDILYDIYEDALRSDYIDNYYDHSEYLISRFENADVFDSDY